VQQPRPAEVVLVADAPWEGNTSAYFTVFFDGTQFRMYYRGSASDSRQRSLHEVTCYAESQDGVQWRKPQLGLKTFAGSTANNIVWIGRASHNFTVFRDTSPHCNPEARYKAFGLAEQGRGLQAFGSPDGIHWQALRAEPVLTDGAFDSQNLAFWDAFRQEYRAYWRIFTDGVRAIRTATSRDFLTWENAHDLVYQEGAPKEHLYTNAVLPYFRAPHILLGFPTRFLPEEGESTEPVFMASRDGVHWIRYPSAVIPRSAPADRAGNRSNYMAWGLVQLPGNEKEISVYAKESYYGPGPVRLRRFVYRLDGFVALRGGPAGGRLITKPLTYQGQSLLLNYRTLSPSGSITVELQDADGKPLTGLTHASSRPMRGDHTAAPVQWDSGAELGSLAGQPVRLSIRLQDAELYALRFVSRSQQ
jgi:hypothetical protein